MDNQEISELLEQYKVTGSQSESLDVPFSPGSQDSISNIHLDFDLGFDRIMDCNELGVAFQQCNVNEDEEEGMFSGVLWTLLDFYLFNTLVIHAGLPDVKDYMLSVSFESQTLPVTKSAAWTFSEPLNRLYVNIGQPCPIRLKLEPCTPHSASLRCFLRYQKSDYGSDPVIQCANHSSLETNLSLRGHVLRCKKVGVQYKKDNALGRYSLCLPFDGNEDDVDGETFVFEFKCLSTCHGLDRRAMELVFQVEFLETVVCCHSVNVRVCSCPGRDRRHDENPLKSTHSLKSRVKCEQSAVSHGSGPLKRHFDDNEEFTIKVRGRKNYELMMAIKQRLEAADAYESQAAEGRQDAQLASPRPKLLMSKERMPTKEQQKDQSKGVLESSDVDRSHHRWRLHHHSQQLQQSQSLPTGKIRKNKTLLGADNCAGPRA